jgi:hypothetical protein
MLDRYFKYPVIADATLGLVLNLVLWLLFKAGSITLPEKTIDVSISTDISTIALTLAGFVLTLLTVLVTFKTAAKVPNEYDAFNTSVFDRFFSSSYYGRTIELLKGSIVILIFVSVLGFVLKLTLRGNCINYIFFANCFGLLIIVTTLWRCLIILTNIVKLQQA